MRKVSVRDAGPKRNTKTPGKMRCMRKRTKHRHEIPKCWTCAGTPRHGGGSDARLSIAARATRRTFDGGWPPARHHKRSMACPPSAHNADASFAKPPPETARRVLRPSKRNRPARCPAATRPKAETQCNLGSGPHSKKPHLPATKHGTQLPPRSARRGKCALHRG